MIDERIMETESFRLICVVADDNEKDYNFWKTCEWTRNQDKTTCVQKAVNERTVHEENCHDSMKASLKRFECEITIPSASAIDSGSWTCKLRKCKDKNDDGGCSSKYASECDGEATINVKVLINLIKYKQSAITMCNFDW